MHSGPRTVGLARGRPHARPWAFGRARSRRSNLSLPKGREGWGCRKDSAGSENPSPVMCRRSILSLTQSHSVRVVLSFCADVHISLYLYAKYIRNALTDPLGQLESSHVVCIRHHTPMRAHENFGGIHALLRQRDKQTTSDL